MVVRHRRHLRELVAYWADGYWITQTIGASQLARRVEVPSGFSLFPADILRPPREWPEPAAV